MKSNIKLAVATALALSTSGVNAKFQEVTLRLKGLNSDFCAYSLGKRLTALEEIEEVKINSAQGTARLVAAAGKEINFSKIEQALKGGPFELRNIHVKAVGKIEKDGDSLLFAVNDSPYKIYLSKEACAECEETGFMARARSTAGGMWNSVVGRFTANEQVLQNTVKKFHDQKVSSAEISCNLHKVRDGLLLGLADNKVRLRKTPQPTEITKTETIKIEVPKVAAASLAVKSAPQVVKVEIAQVPKPQQPQPKVAISVKQPQTKVAKKA